MIPPRLSSEVEAQLRPNFGSDVRITGTRPASGGCISGAAHLALSGGRGAFLKWLDSPPPPGFFWCEADGLARLAAASPLHIPRVYAVSEPESDLQFLLMEDVCVAAAASLSSGSGRDNFDEELGRGLAVQHRATAEAFGLDHDNYIGITPQHNTWNTSWPAFFRECRILPLLDALESKRGLPASDRKLFERLAVRLDELLTNGVPSLLHGDLWSGNVLSDTMGRPVLIDPAVYYGHREVDIAYTDLFGGLSRTAIAAYHEEWPLEDGHRERAPLLNLYHLLNHALLFGGGYLAQARADAVRYVGGKN